MIEKIISGGQTGVDRAALDAALDCGCACGGACPRGRRAEDGVIPERYPLTELEDADYVARTHRNVDDADGTLILHFGAISGGTEKTLRRCVAVGKPHLTVDALVTSVDDAAMKAAAFCDQHAIRVLNVAGPRASAEPRAYACALAIVAALLDRAGAGPDD